MRHIAVFAVLVLLFGCVGEEVPPAPEVPLEPGPAIPETYGEFSEGNFSLEYPSSWEIMENMEDEDALTAGDGMCVMVVRKTALPPEYMKGVISKYADVEWDGDGGEFDFDVEGGEVHSKSRLVFCECSTYWVSVNCPKGSFDLGAAEKVLGSAECAYEMPPAYSGKGKPGMIVLATDETVLETYCQNVQRAREAGAPLLHGYISWGSTEKAKGEYDWSGQDYEIEVGSLYGMERSVVVDIIRTNDIGEVPSDFDFKGFEDGELKERFSEFVVLFLDRYGENITYIEIGNEVDIYLRDRRDEIATYREFYEYVYGRVKEAHPEVKVGTVFAYHAAKSSNSTDIIEELEDVGDFNAFTLYIYGPGFMFDRNVGEAREFFDEMDAISSKPFVVTETGWSTSPMLGSDEETQAEYVEEVFSILEEKKDRIEFLAWFDSNDIPDETCGLVAESFILEEQKEFVESETMEYFEEFICNLGLRTVDNEPKPGWFEWVERSREYTGLD